MADNTFDVLSLRGGLDDTTPHIALAQDSCITAENVEFVDTMLGERRLGCTAIGLSADFANVNLDAVTWMYRHLPSNTQLDAELWALAQSLTVGTNVLARRKTGAWETITPAIDAIDSTVQRGHRMHGQTFHGKLFLAHKSSVDRLHVYDGGSLRRCGLAEPAAPTAANQGAGAIRGGRFYRVRYIFKSGSTVVIRSEPSDVLEFLPSGAGASVRVTRPALLGEIETHWELEASMDISGGVNPEPGEYYTIATVAVGTTTFDDTYTSTTLGAGAYAVYPNELADEVGMHSTIPSGKFLCVDEDRLLIAGSWENSAEASRVRWTPVFADPTANNNDERMDLTVDPFLDLDGFEGGEITGISRAVSGYIFVFKQGHIYKLVRTNSRAKSYEAVPLTKARGALVGSVVEAVNQSGQPSVFFLDPTVGPCRVSSSGLQWCGRDIQSVWQRVNINTSVPCHGVYYSKKRQVHYWIAVDGSSYPNMKIVLHVNEMRDADEGARRGWVTVAKDNRIATAHCSGMFPDNTDTTALRSFQLAPFIGKQSWVVGASTIRNYIQQCDTGSTDAHTTGDTGSAYSAVVTSKPYSLTGLLQQYEIRGGSIVLASGASPTGLVFIKAIRDFGKETKLVSTAFYPENGEAYVIKPLNELAFSELYTVQLSFGDLDSSVTPPAAWGIDWLQLRVSTGNTL